MLLTLNFLAKYLLFTIQYTFLREKGKSPPCSPTTLPTLNIF